ncbi:MAG: GTPase Era [Acidobacteriota bacterium]|jgi:GTPase
MKFGLASIIGRPNVGKSTLMNGLIGTKISIVSDKPQTTRARILGVLNQPDVQIVFVDTPGIHRPGHRLNERMMAEVEEAMREVDLLLHMVDASERLGKGEKFVLEMVRSVEARKFLLLNKVDKINKAKVLPMIESFSEEGIYDEIFPLSALTGENVDLLLETMVRYLPEGQPMYPPEYLTNQNERFLVAEIIREKVLHHTRQELPYTTAVLIEEFDESKREEGFVRITASILVEKDGQKKIVIGRGGKVVKQIGIEARQEIETLLQVRQIFLGLNVKVEPGWRNKEPLLDALGVGWGRSGTEVS